MAGSYLILKKFWLNDIICESTEKVTKLTLWDVIIFMHLDLYIKIIQ